MGRKTYFWQKEYSKHIGATFLLVTSFIALVLMCCGVPLEVLIDRPDSSKCYTLWGRHSPCRVPDYEWRVLEEDCADRRFRWETAEAFSIISIFSILILFGAAWYQVGGSAIKVPILLLSLFTIGSTCVPWAIVAAFYNTKFCGQNTMHSETKKYGAGFGLMVASAALQGVGLLAFIFGEP